jgi:hypothetical protein
VITVTPGTLPGATVGTVYTQPITASGGVGPYSFSLTAGALPAGVTLTPGGVLAGTPTAPGTASFTLRITDANGCFVEGPATLVVAIPSPSACPVITVTPGTLPSATVGAAYTQAIAAAGGVGPYTFTVTAGALPAGMTLTAGGVLAGTPTAAGTASFTLRVTDSSSGCFVEGPATLAVITAVPTLPQVFAVLLGLLLATTGYLRLRAADTVRSRAR